MTPPRLSYRVRETKLEGFDMQKFSVNVEGEFYKRVGKGEKDNVDYEIKGLKVSAKSEDFLPPVVRDAALIHLRSKVDRKASAIRTFHITAITHLGADKGHKPVEVKKLEDMNMAELRQFAEDNKIRLPAEATSRQKILEFIQEWDGDRDDGAIAGEAKETFEGETGDGETEEEELEDEEDGEELDDRGQPIKK